MAYYITYGEFQQHMKDYFFRTGSRMQFPEMADYLYRKGLLSETPPDPILTSEMFGDMDDDAFNKIIDQLPLELNPQIAITPKVKESDIFPNSGDVFIIRHPRYTRPAPHIHNYFEINYVASGSCTFVFEKSKRTMQEGELCIIALSSEHDLVIDDDSTVFCIMLRKSTFDTTFFSLLSRKDLLSYFFRTILQDDSHANYLLFFSENNKWLKQIIHNAMGESYKNDSYSNACCISWINLLFSNLLRNYSKTLQFYDYQMGADFSLVLQYIQHNYQTVTLASLAELFHYSEPHLCTLIKQNTGHTFTGLIKRLRLAEAIDYLTNTNLKIGEIAEKVGYNSADHFSRVFRSTYKMSPQEYRKQNSHTEEAFVPFEVKNEKTN
ncbi:AraC family transcriptional regulator [Mediterraneibacter gnavus]|jgi:AraC-like DNA-binding protein|uniref:AraC family transcriptional regulator n=1 Tax=Mediterraneibacter gnavus TaxID=33038 RepID=UPI000E51A0C3|nr:AraC family transcriptional regulator [Mediterraneibacter gnavus]RGW26409.1 AraC family transcriptional regulator [Mediterraneibacter gnavus]RGZ31111.1 AraC family transcriptional regulator [Mediterraneibacter gnavus]